MSALEAGKLKACHSRCSFSCSVQFLSRCRDRALVGDDSNRPAQSLRPACDCKSVSSVLVSRYHGRAVRGNSTSCRPRLQPNVQLKAVVDERVPAQVLGDRARLQQILNNLVLHQLALSFAVDLCWLGIRSCRFQTPSSSPRMGPSI
jgi:hypothetical protein